MEPNLYLNLLRVIDFGEPLDYDPSDTTVEFVDYYNKTRAHSGAEYIRLLEKEAGVERKERKHD